MSLFLKCEEYDLTFVGSIPESNVDVNKQRKQTPPSYAKILNRNETSETRKGFTLPCQNTRYDHQKILLITFQGQA